MNVHADTDEFADIEMSISKFKQMLDDNALLRDNVTELTQRLESTTRGQAQEALRLNDQIAFLQQQIVTVQRERDLFASYAVDVKARTESLGRFMDQRAAGVESEIEQSVESIRRFISEQVDGLIGRLGNDAKTARTLVDDALSASKTDVVARLQDSRAAG